MRSWLTHTLYALLKPIVEIRPGERMKTLLMFSYFFLTIALIYILKPVRNSLFLDELGAGALRYIYMGEGIFLIFVVAAYVQFAKRASKKVLYNGILLFFISNLVLFWFFFKANAPYLSAVFYIWVASFSVTMTTQFWMLANDTFNPMEAKRLFGLIISGGSAGGILGGILTNQAVRWMDTEDLLLLAAAIVLVCLFLVGFLWKQIPSAGGHAAANEPEHEGRENKDPAKPDDVSGSQTERSFRKVLRGSSYVVMLAGIVMISKICSTIIDNQFNWAVETSVIGTDARTAFFGGFMASLNAISFVMQFFVTSLCLRYLGVGISLWLLPSGLFILSAATFFNPVLLTGLAFKIFDGSMNYSVQQASKEVLYLPLSGKLRRRVKPIIDMLGYRFGKTFGGLVIIVMSPLLGIGDARLGLLVLLLLPLWMVFVWKIKGAYSDMLRDHIRSRHQYGRMVMAYRATDVMSFLHDEKNFHKLHTAMRHGSSAVRKLAATAILAYARSANDLESARKIVDRMAKEEAFETVITNGRWLSDEDVLFFAELMDPEGKDGTLVNRVTRNYLKHSSELVLMRLGGVLRDPLRGMEQKRRAVRILEFIPTQNAADLLLHLLAGARDHAFRYVMVTALNRIHDRNPRISINRFLVKNEIAREVRIHERIQKLRRYYNENRNITERENYLEVAMKAIQDESLERIFEYLDLLYPNEMMQVIHDQIMENADGNPTRAHAVELLSNTLEPNMLLMVQKIVDGRMDIDVKEKEAIEILKDFGRSEDRWFSITSHFLTTELRLGDRWPELSSLEYF